MTPTRKKNVLQKFQSPTALLGSLKCKLVIDQETRPLILFLAEKKAMVRRVSAEGFEVFHQKMSTIRKKMNPMACTKAIVTTIHRRLSINMDASLQRMHTDLDRTGKERGPHNTSAESVVEVGPKIVDVGEYYKMPSGKYLKKPG
jgi:hypothetical protein